MINNIRDFTPIRPNRVALDFPISPNTEGTDTK